MLIVLSPAKRLDFKPAPVEITPTRHRFQADVAELSKTTRKLTKPDLRRMMSISADLAALNRERFQAFDAEAETGEAAIFTFAGDVYQGLHARTLSAPDLKWAQGHVRILSGLYGLLRPLDRIQPYRLEMGVRLKTKRGHSLYDYWGDRISSQLNADAKGMADPTLVNLASQEYFGAVDAAALSLPVVNIHFLEAKDGEERVISFFAKKARGAMARYAIDERIDRAEGLKAFDRDGYRFNKTASTDTDWTFTRPQPEPPVRGKR